MSDKEALEAQATAYFISIGLGDPRKLRDQRDAYGEELATLHSEIERRDAVIEAARTRLINAQSKARQYAEEQKAGVWVFLDSHLFDEALAALKDSR